MESAEHFQEEKIRRSIYVPARLDELVQRFAHEDMRSYSGAVAELLEAGLQAKGYG